MVEEIPQSQTQLTRFLRLEVYSFLTLKETVKKAACLSKQEREELKQSEIARTNKTFTLTINNQSRPQCLLYDDRLEQFYRRIETRVQLTDKLSIEVESNLQNYSDEMIGEELALFFNKLPVRIDQKKLILKVHRLAA